MLSDMIIIISIHELHLCVNVWRQLTCYMAYPYIPREVGSESTGRNVSLIVGSPVFLEGILKDPDLRVKTCPRGSYWSVSRNALCLACGVLSGGGEAAMPASLLGILSVCEDPLPARLVDAEVYDPLGGSLFPGCCLN